MSPPEFLVKLNVSIESDHPDLAELIEAVDATTEGTLERSRAMAELVTEYYHVHLATASWCDGHRVGHDDGASPFLDGPWWRRAWTAARS